MTYTPMYSRQRADFVAAVEAEVQPLVTQAEAAQTAAETARDEAIAAPLEPTIAALGQATDGGITALSDAVAYVENGISLDWPNGYFRSGTSQASSFTALGIATATQASDTWWRDATGKIVKFAANTVRQTNRGLMVEAGAVNALGSDPFSTTGSTGAAAVVTGVAAPDGTNTAFTLTDSSTSATQTYNKVYSFTITAGAWIGGFFVKKAASSGQGAAALFRYTGINANQDRQIRFDPFSGAYAVQGGGTATVETVKDQSGNDWYWIIPPALTVNAHDAVQVTFWPAIAPTHGATDSVTATGSITVWFPQVQSGSTLSQPFTGTRAADSVAFTLPAGSTSDQVKITYGSANTVATITRSALANPLVFNPGTDGSGAWKGQTITKIELIPASASTAQISGQIKRAVREYGLYPRPTGALAANDTPTLTLGSAGAASAITGLAAGSEPAVTRTDSKITYVSGVPMLRGATYPNSRLFTSRGAYYGAADGIGTPLRGTSYFAYEAVHTGTQFEIPLFGAGGAGVNVRVLVNGCIGGTVSVPNSTGSFYYLRVVFPASGTRTIRVETAGVPCNGFHAASASEFASVGRDYPLVTVIGDSFAEGTGSETGDIESVVAARALGFNVALAAVGSTGLINAGGNNTSGYPKVAWTHPERLTDLTLSGVTSAQTGAAVSPAMGVVFASVNDESVSSGTWGAFGATLTDAIQNRADVLIDAWLAAHPGKPLVFFGPLWPSGLPDNRPTLNIYRIRDGVQRACWARVSQNVHFIDRFAFPRREGVYTTTTDQAYLYTGGTSGTDATHPTPAGHRFDGLTDADALRELILSRFA